MSTMMPYILRCLAKVAVVILLLALPWIDVSSIWAYGDGSTSDASHSLRWVLAACAVLLIVVSALWDTTLAVLVAILVVAVAITPDTTPDPVVHTPGGTTYF